MFDAARITPAGAGKTGVVLIFVRVLQDHPRRCGENRNISVSGDKAAGSPPQVRGKQLVPDPDAVGTGITPAGAGKT